MFGILSKGEKKKNKAALKIQCAFRCYLARRKIKGLYRCHYIRYYDQVTRSYVFKNKRTLEIEHFKPTFLGRNFNMPTPRKNGEKAPNDYNPGNEYNLEGYLLLITCNEFPIGNWSEVNVSTNADHEMLKTVLQHDFIGKFLIENVFNLKNPSLHEVLEMFSYLQKKCYASGFLVIYLCTHIITVIKGDKKNKKEKNYLAVKNTVWGKPQEIIETSISLSCFINEINKIKCSKKSILLNYAHVQKPRPRLFPSSRIPYPAPDFVSTLASKANCAVLACCATGASLKTYIKYSPLHKLYSEELLNNHNELQERNLYDDNIIGLISNNNTTIHPMNNAMKNNDNDEESIGGYSLGSFGSLGEATIQSGTGRINREEYSRILKVLMAEWGLKPLPEIKKSPKPVQPSASWEYNADYERFDITLPEKSERDKHNRRIAYWRIKRTLAKPGNFIKKNLRKRTERNFTAPCEMSNVEGNLSLFARAIVNAIRGGACKTDSEIVTIDDVFKFIRKQFKIELARINAANQVGFINPDDELGATPIEIHQTPLLFIPPGRPEMIKNPICFRCGPPAAPDRPYIIKSGDNDVTLEWYNPKFDGVPPIKYKIAMRNHTRNFSNWQDLYYPGDITKTRFLVRNLPMGVPCEFRIAAWNSAGWGQYSDESKEVIPGEDHEVLPDRIRRSRIRQGGALAVLDRLDAYPAYRDEVIIGFRVLMGFGQVTCGFKSSLINTKVAQHALKALKTFRMDPDIASLAFQLLSWCMRSIQTERKVRQLCLEDGIVDTVQRYIDVFRTNDRVLGSICALSGAMPKYLPQIPEMNYKTLVPQEGDVSEEEEEDDDEEEQLEDEEEKEELKSEETKQQDIVKRKRTVVTVKEESKAEVAAGGDSVEVANDAELAGDSIKSAASQDTIGAVSTKMGWSFVASSQKSSS